MRKDLATKRYSLVSGHGRRKDTSERHRRRWSASSGCNGSTRSGVVCATLPRRGGVCEWKHSLGAVADFEFCHFASTVPAAGISPVAHKVVRSSLSSPSIGEEKRREKLMS
jgi:hypothetical protein